MHNLAATHPVLSEKGLLFPVLLLCGIGITMVCSASCAISLETHNTLYYYMERQAVFFALSLGVMFTAASLPFRLYKSLAWIILLSSLLLLILVLVPALKVKAGGACRWLNLFGFTFQPAEFAKLALIIFMAYSLSKKQPSIHDFSIGFVPHFMIYLLFAGLILLQPDFGTIVVMGMICWGMMFVAGVKLLHLLSPLPLLIPAVYFLIFKVDYRLQRIMTFMNAWDDPYNTGYQITQSLKAFGAGGLAGRGLGLGIQKMYYLPEPHTDFILSIIGEELGFFGVIFILVLYAVILIKGSKIARNSKSMFGAVAAAGLTIYLGIQVIINAGVTLGVLPTKGLTLPFISYGGTSLLVNMAGIGILMNIGASVRHGK